MDCFCIARLLLELTALFSNSCCNASSLHWAALDMPMSSSGVSRIFRSLTHTGVQLIQRQTWLAVQEILWMWLDSFTVASQFWILCIRGFWILCIRGPTCHRPAITMDAGLRVTLARHGDASLRETRQSLPVRVATRTTHSMKQVSS